MKTDSLKICSTCKRYQDCPKPTNQEDFCLCWEDEASSKLWRGIEYAIASHDLKALVTMLNDKYPLQAREIKNFPP